MTEPFEPLTEQKYQQQMLTSPRNVPSDILERLTDWNKSFLKFQRFNYGLGSVGLLASLLTIAFPQYGQYLAIISGACFGLLGYVNPRNQYTKYVKAWRILSDATMRWKYEESFTLKELLNAVRRGESIITEFEERELADNQKIAKYQEKK